MHRSLILIAALGALSTGACGHKADTDETAGNSAAQSSEVPGKGVDRTHAGGAIPAAEIYNADDDAATLKDRAGKPLLVNLWASWCAPCVKELPTLDQLSRRPGGPRVIAVSEDIGERPSVDAFLNEHGIANVEVWRDPKMSLSAALGVQVMPTTVYYDSSGHELWRYVGDLDWTSDEAARLLADGGGATAR